MHCEVDVGTLQSDRFLMSTCCIEEVLYTSLTLIAEKFKEILRHKNEKSAKLIFKLKFFAFEKIHKR